MFGKIKDKLKGLFEKTEEVVEENPDEIIEVEEPPKLEKPKAKPKKKEVKEEPEKKKETKKKTEKKEEKARVPKKEEKKPEVKPKKEEKEIVEVSEPLPEPPQLEEELPELPKFEEEAEEEKPKKKGFFSKVFGKKDEEESKEEEVLELPEPTSDSESDSDVSDKVNESESELEKEESGLFTKTFKKLKSKKITEEDFERIWVELEIFLLEINIAYEIVDKIGQKLREALIGNAFDRFKLTEKIREVMAAEVEEVLSDREADFLEILSEYKAKGEILKILVLGVNGTGKTTSIAKIVRYMQKNDCSVVVAAADTFRAAAMEQLEEHSNRIGFKLIQHKGGSDPAAVAYDAIEHAKAKKLDVVLIDTAGRMPNNSNLMMELEKVKKVSDAQIALFVGDSVSGNDLIDQIELFDKGVTIDGVVLTKVDTDERPGSIVTTAYSIEKPIYFLGVGQDYDDLVKFDAKEVAEKLFSIDDEEE